ncbi:LOW QUALITY PROTEIN: neural cell adhesion molecule L1-like [Rhinoraja longicauda]
MTGDKRALLPLLLLPLLLLLTFCQQCNSIRIPPQYKLQKKLPQPPIITEQTLENYTVFPTDDIVLKCEATGEPMPIFRWTKDGRFFDPTLDPRVTLNTSSGTMVIATSNNGISFRGYQGTYRCYVSNDGGTAVSSKINLKTESTPKWPKESVQQFGKEEGESLVLQCNPPTSMASSMIIWMTSKLFNIKLSDRVSQGLDGNLYFSNLLVEDSLEDYTCYAQLPGTRTIIQKEPIALEVTTSNSVRFRKPRLLHPRGQSSPRLALRDRPLHLECIAEGLPTPTVHWEQLDGNLPGGRVSYENFNKTLTIHHVAEEDDGEYQCIVINGQGRVTHTFSVTVEAAPYWVRKPQDGVYGPGENVLLDCDVDAKPKAHIRWSVNGVPLNETDSDGRRTVTGSRVVLTAVKPEDTAVYQCLAENRHGKLLANIIVQVIELPTQILTPSDLEYQFVEKQTAYIHCKAFGAPTPKIAWSKEDMTTVLQDVRYFQYTNGTLRIVDVQEADAGGYTCNASNGVGTDSLLAALDIKNASQIVEAPRDQHVQRLHAATFSCVVEVDPSLPPPSLQWSKDGQTVDEADDDDSKYHIREGLLKVKSVGYEDEGMYKCEASSLLDSVTASAQLIVVDYPDPPFDLQVDGFTAREALLSWTPGNDRNSPIERFLVEFEEDLFEPGIWQLLQMVEGDHHEAQLDLSPYVNYSFRVVAVNRLGRSEPSPATQHYMTPPAAPEKNPEGVKGEGSHPSNMIITWQVLKGLDRNGPGLQYEVKWRRQDVEDEWKELVVESPPYLVNATPTFVPYQIQVQAINEEGSAPEPHTVIGYSGEDYPLHSPKSVTVENVSSSSVRVKWTRVPTESLRGLLRGYNISYWEHQSTGRHHQVLHGDHNHALIKELKPYTTYDLEVRVFNSKGESPLNDTPYQFITPEGVPSKPTLLQLELLKDTEVTASWHPPRQPNGIITGYVLHYQQINGTVSSPLREQIVPSPDTSRLTVHDLQPHAFYHFHVLAETVAGRGPAASRDIFTSQEGDAWGQSCGDTAILPLPFSQISYWEHQSTGRHHQVFHGDHNHALIKELKPYTTYDLEVRVFNSKGESPLNVTPYQFITPEGVPSKPTLLQLELLKDTEVTASWHPPRQPNGIITGYVLHYQQINGTVSSPLREQIVPSPDTSRLTVHDLQPHAFYHFHVLAETVAGRGPAASRDIFTSQEGEPRVLKNISHLMGDTHTNFSWIGLDGHRVTELLIQYMSKTGDGDWKYSKIVNSSQNFFTLDKLHPGTPYHIRLWQLGRFKNLAIWDQEVETLGPAVSVLDNGIATQGWFIGLISAIVLLVLILLIICFIKRNKGGKYSVKDKEDAHVDSEARPMKDETFGEYSDNDQEEKRFEGSQPSLEQQIRPLGSDDSLVEYGGSVDVQFNEDGSFIGQYSGKKEEKEAASSSAGGSAVNVDITLD